MCLMQWKYQPDIPNLDAQYHVQYYQDVFLKNEAVELIVVVYNAVGDGLSGFFYLMQHN